MGEKIRWGAKKKEEELIRKFYSDTEDQSTNDIKEDKTEKNWFLGIDYIFWS